MRDPRGYRGWTIGRLAHYGVNLRAHDMPELETPLICVGPAAYLRLHGYGVKSGGSHPDHVLTAWATWAREERAAGRDVHVYFNNDINGYAVRDAERFRRFAGVRRVARTSTAGSRVAR